MRGYGEREALHEMDEAVSAGIWRQENPARRYDGFAATCLHGVSVWLCSCPCCRCRCRCRVGAVEVEGPVFALLHTARMGACRARSPCYNMKRLHHLIYLRAFSGDI